MLLLHGTVTLQLGPTACLSPILLEAARTTIISMTARHPSSLRSYSIPVMSCILLIEKLALWSKMLISNRIRTFYRSQTGSILAHIEKTRTWRTMVEYAFWRTAARRKFERAGVDKPSKRTSLILRGKKRHSHSTPLCRPEAFSKASLTRHLLPTAFLESRQAFR